MHRCEDGQACMAIGAAGGIGQQRVQSGRRLFLLPPVAVSERSVGQFVYRPSSVKEMTGCANVQPLMQLPHIEDLQLADEQHFQKILRPESLNDGNLHRTNWSEHGQPATRWKAGMANGPLPLRAISSLSRQGFRLITLEVH